MIFPRREVHALSLRQRSLPLIFRNIFAFLFIFPVEFFFFSQDQNSDRASVSSLGALDSESTSLTDEDVCNDFESASPQENTTSEIKGIGLSRTSLESTASHDGPSKQFDQCGKRQLLHCIHQSEQKSSSFRSCSFIILSLGSA